jgi:ATP-dependent Lon protease
MTSGEHWLALFPLRLVLLPNERLPLHIFEARYQAMLKRCESNGEPFGVILAQPELAEVGCTAMLTEVLRHHPDGRSDIVATGGERFSVVETRTHGDGYLEARTTPYADIPTALPTPAGPLLIELLHRLQQEEGESDSSEEIDPSTPGYTFRIAAHCPMELQDRQALLALRSESSREEVLLRELTQAIPRARQRREDQFRVYTNGHLEPH